MEHQLDIQYLCCDRELKPVEEGLSDRKTLEENLERAVSLLECLWKKLETFMDEVM